MSSSSSSTERRQPPSSSVERTTTEADHVIFGESLYDIPRPAMTHCTLAQFPCLASSPEVKVDDPNETSVAAADQLMMTQVTTFQRPIVADVKIFKPETPASKANNHRLVAPPEDSSSWSAEAIDRLDILSRLHDDDFSFRFRNRASTFANPSNPKQSIYIDLGEYQTLLGHAPLHEEAEEEDDDDEEEEEEEERRGGGRGGVYSLPQPLSYGVDTMKAVENVTQRFDSFRLRQMRVRSFRESGTYSRRRSSNCSGGGGGGRRASRRQSSSASIDDGDEDSAAAAAAEAIDGGRLNGVQLTERDIYRIEVFYRGGGAEVCVCRCLSDVFLGATARPSEEPHPAWVQIHTGVPVLLLNTGEGLRPRELSLVVAQRDTALPLWQDKVTYLSEYHESSPAVHSMKVSGSLSKCVQLRMGEVEAAKDFLNRFQAMTSDRDDELWKVSADQTKVKDGHNRTGQKQKQKKDISSSSSRRRHVTKADISQPCNSTRLTRVSATDRNFRSAFGGLLPVVKEFIKSNEADDGGFRPRLPTN